MKRVYENVLMAHLNNNRQMCFIAGPRQAGKTTTSFAIQKHFEVSKYLNWDNTDDQRVILQGPKAVASFIGLDSLTTAKKLLVIFDEIHKYSKWKQFLKGFFDTYSHKVQIIVTGSAKLDVYKKTGDSLMGRYFLYRLHPLSLAELANNNLKETEITDPIKVDESSFNNLLQFGGFPEPYLQANTRFYGRWKRLRFQQLFQEDIRDLTQIQELAQCEMLATLIREQAGQLVNYSNLANAINTTAPSITRWIKTLEAFYYCFTISPWHNNVKRSLKKEPKVFLWDWAQIKDESAKFENMVASHLLKSIHYWTDLGLGKYSLHFLRDKEKREVDFLITKNEKPWFIVEAKIAKNQGISKNLYYYQEMLNCPYAFQVTRDMPFVNKNCFDENKPIIVPATTFLSQLV